MISTGSHDTTSQSYATKGEWATKWCVYDNDGNLITCGTPADFLDTNSEQYKALNITDYLNKPVKISYERVQSTIAVTLVLTVVGTIQLSVSNLLLM